MSCWSVAHLQVDASAAFLGKPVPLADLCHSEDVDLNQLRPDKLGPTKIDFTWQLEVLDDSDP